MSHQMLSIVVHYDSEQVPPEEMRKFLLNQFNTDVGNETDDGLYNFQFIGHTITYDSSVDSNWDDSWDSTR